MFHEMTLYVHIIKDSGVFLDKMLFLQLKKKKKRKERKGKKAESQTKQNLKHQKLHKSELKI